MIVGIQIGSCIIKPYQTPSGAAMIEIMKIEGMDEHDHPFGPTVTVEVEKLFTPTAPSPSSSSSA